MFWHTCFLTSADKVVCTFGRATDPSIDMKILIPSFGASAVLLFAVPESKLSQPRNFVGDSRCCDAAASLIAVVSMAL